MYDPPSTQAGSQMASGLTSYRDPTAELGVEASSPVTVAMNELSTQIGRIEDQRCSLAARLGGLSAPAAPAAEPKLAADSPGASEHVAALCAMVRAASMIADDLRDMTRRLEV